MPRGEWSVGPSPETVPYQRPGTAGSLPDSETLRACPGGKAHVSQDRQHLSGVSHKSSGRHEVSPLPSAGTGTSDLGGYTPPVHTCETHSRCHLNIAADSLSRGGPRPANWRLHKEIVQLIWNTYGAAAVDLFASKETTHCPLWFAEQVESLGRDALSHEWPDLLLYAFPPIPLIWAVLSRVREMGHRVLLIAPRWPSMPWFHLLLTLTAGPPSSLPLRKDLLSQMEGSLWHPCPDKLKLGLATGGNQSVVGCSEWVKPTV